MKIFSLLVTIIIASCSDHRVKSTALSENVSTNVGHTESLELLKKSPLIEFSYKDTESGKIKTLKITDSERLTNIRSWIIKNAWPPIDQMSIGSVIPRGDLRVYRSADLRSEVLHIPLYSAKSRSDQTDIHIMAEPWQNLLHHVTK